MKYTQKGEFGAAMRGYVALGGARSDQDTYRLDVITAGLFHGLRHANFDPRIAACSLGAIRPDVERAMAEARKAWEANKKANFSDAKAEESAKLFAQPVIAALRELRETQDRNKEEKKQAKEAAARAEVLARMDSEAKGKPSEWLLKSPDGTVELSSAEFDTLMGLLADVRKGERPVTVDVSRTHRKERDVLQEVKDEMAQANAAKAAA